MAYTIHMHTTPTLDNAFQTVPRSLFLPKNVAIHADLDTPLPIGFGQTNSQPSTVYSMLEWLAVEPGNSILDVGSGSGWTTALLSVLTGPSGHVTAVEIVPELLAFGRHNCAALHLYNVQFVQASKKTHGYVKNAPYDRILVSATAPTIPTALLEQLANNGRMVIPVDTTILEIEKHGTVHETTKHPGYVFVPLV